MPRFWAVPKIPVPIGFVKTKLSPGRMALFRHTLVAGADMGQPVNSIVFVFFGRPAVDYKLFCFSPFFILFLKFAYPLYNRLFQEFSTKIGKLNTHV